MNALDTLRRIHEDAGSQAAAAMSNMASAPAIHSRSTNPLALVPGNQSRVSGNPLDLAPAASPPPQAPANINPFSPPKAEPRMQLLQSAADAFQKSFAPNAFDARQQLNKADQAEALKKNIATLQQVRALPVERRMALLPQLSRAIGQNVPPEYMSDEQIDGQLAIMMGEAGIAPDKPKVMSEYEAAQVELEKEKAGRPTYLNTRGGVVAAGPDGTAKMAYELPAEGPDLPAGMRMGANGQPEWIPGYIQGYRQMHPQSPSSSGNAPPSGYRWVAGADGQPALEKIPGGPADKPAGSEFTQTQVNRFTGQAQGLDAIEFAVREFQDAIDKYGTVTGDRNMNPLDPGSFGAKRTDAAELDAKHNHLTMLLKSPEMFNLGVLTGPDLELLLKSVPDPTGFESLGTNKENVTASLDALRRFIAYRRGQIPEKFQAKKQEQPQQRQGGIFGMLQQFRQGAPQDATAVPQPAQGEDDIDPELSAQLDAIINSDDDGEGPQEGDVEDGFRFLGGDPADPANWEPVQ